MRPLFGLAFFVAAAVPLAADDKDDAMKKLNGTYDVVSVTVEGKPEPKKSNDTQFVIKDGTIRIFEGGMEKKRDGAKFTVDPSKKPATIDIELDSGPQKELNKKGIYELKETDKGVELTIAIGEEKRPTDFKGDVMLFKLLRKKEK